MSLITWFTHWSWEPGRYVDSEGRFRTGEILEFWKGTYSTHINFNKKTPCGRRTASYNCAQTTCVPITYVAAICAQNWVSLDLAGFLNHWVPWGTHTSTEKQQKKKFCSKCFDPYTKSCAFAMRSCSTKYGSIIFNSRRAYCTIIDRWHDHWVPRGTQLESRQI